MSKLCERSWLQTLAYPLCLSLSLVGCSGDDDDDDVIAPALVVADFDWRMTERTRSVINTEFKPEVNVEHRMIEGPVAGQPGLYAGVSSVPLDQINPAGGFELTLDGCASIGAVQYIWTIDGTEAARTDSCSFTTRLAQGDHEVTLTVEGSGLSDALTETVVVKDIILVIMGDSYTSGEGNGKEYQAEVEDSTLDEATANNGAGWSEGAYWDYANCHRSTRSGSANAAIDLEQADPRSSVTTIYVACSGAQIDSGILGIKDGNLGAAEAPQAKQAYDLVIGNGRKIDAIVLGIGGNDIGFVPIVAECALQDDCFYSTEESPGFTIPDLPVTDKTTAIEPAALAALTLKPHDAFPNLAPGPPWLVLEPNTLHSCDSVYQDALLGSGGIGPAQSCRQSIGTSPAGLAQVAQCFNGEGTTDCVSQPSYYDFVAGQYKYSEGQTWPGLNVPANRVFYTEYPDLTTVFQDEDPQAELEYCEIAITKEQLLTLLEVAQKFSDNPALIGLIIAGLDSMNLASIGLTKNEFEYAAEAVLGGIDNPEPRVLTMAVTSNWNVKAPGGPLATTTIGPDEPVDSTNLGTAAPALNEVTRLAQSSYGWEPVLGTFDLSSGHGLCAPAGVDLESSAAYAYLIAPAEGTNISGSAHPNLLGQEAYRRPIADALKTAFGF